MTKAKYSKKASSKIPFIAICIVIVLLISITAITLVKSGSDTILSGVSVGGVDLSGKTVEEAELLISQRINELKDQKIEVKAGSDTFSATYSDFGASYDCKVTAENAYNYGHGNFFTAIVPSLKSFFGVDANIDLSVYINSRAFDENMAEFTDYDKSVQASYEFVEGAIKVTNGKSAYTINPVTAKQVLTDALKKLDFSAITFEKEQIDPIPLDISFIASHYSSEAVSATYYRDAEGNIKVTDGNDKVTVDEKNAHAIIEAHTTPGETFEIPATIEFAEHTRDELEEALFRDMLGSKTTSFASSNANRSHNVSLAASSINNKILLPGEKLSYNEALGRRTPEAGYKLAGAYLNGQTVQEYGGGICQISSTLYMAVLLSNLKIEDRLCHMFPVSYVPLGLDATVDYGTVDFVFSNDTEYPIKVVCYTTENKQAVCEIYGTKTENFSVSFETTGISSIPFTTETIEDPTLPLGEEVIETEGSNGTKCTVYRIVSVDGEVKSRTFESQSYYIPKKEVKRVGTMVVEVPSETPATGEAGAAEIIPEASSEPAPVVPEVSSEAAPAAPAEPVVSEPSVSEL